MATRRALVVGVNDYAPTGSGGPDLRGCVNDARDMANTLVICGFSPLNIRILTNQNATRANIIARLISVLKDSKAGDSVVFYYSGHGTRVANVGADFEVDGLDEAICPHDFESMGVLKDDDFSQIFKDYLKPAVNLDVVLDSCHSGTGTRDLQLISRDLTSDLLDQAFEENTPSYNGIRFVQPMLEDEFYFTFERQLELKKKRASKDRNITRAIVPVAGMKHTLWAACKDNQVSMEGNIGGNIRGYFTYHFCKVLRATNGNIKRSVLDMQVANGLASMGAAQINQTEASPAEFSQNIFV